LLKEVLTLKTRRHTAGCGGCAYCGHWRPDPDPSPQDRSSWAMMS